MDTRLESEEDGLVGKIQNGEFLRLSSDKLFFSGINHTNYVNLPGGNNRYFIIRYLGPVEGGTIYLVEFLRSPYDDIDHQLYHGSQTPIKLNTVYKIPDSEIAKLEVAKILN